MAKIDLTVTTVTSSVSISRTLAGESRKDAARLVLLAISDVVPIYKLELRELIQEARVVINELVHAMDAGEGSEED